MTLSSCTFDSPVGMLHITVDGAGRLVRIELPGSDRVPPTRGDAARSATVLGQLAEYFAGRRREFALALAPAGTPFQLAVWQALRAIPYGATISYAELARRIGRPSAVRAVGAANGRNPIPIVVPCHRVIGADGSLTGFGGGLACKRKLLELEGLRVGGDAARDRVLAAPR